MPVGETSGAPSGCADIVKRGLESLKKADLHSAREDFEAALKDDFDDPLVMFALKCCGFWAEREGRAMALRNLFERGDFILGQWKSFQAFLERQTDRQEDAVYAFRQYAFSLALKAFVSISSEAASGQNADLELRIGRCYKGKGEFEAAIDHLETALKAKRDSGEIMAELADAYALVDQTRTAKALFREAFFMDASAIDIEGLESYLIRRLAERVSEMGFSGESLKEWLPVYGVLLGVFSVKRELRAIEIGKLRQSIYQLENELKDPGADKSIIVPRLVYRYFWLIDHYVSSGEDRTRIEETLLKIQLLDPDVHKLYMS